MKKIILTMVMLFTAITGINAMSYRQARDQALFLTDKMAYELNLNEEQYEAAYEINLDYLMNVNTVDDVYSSCWRQRNADLEFILLDWQYRSFCAVSYFFRPLYWSAGNWHFGIYAHYPRRDFYYFNRPTCYVSYRGAHSWRHNGGASWYVRHARPYHYHKNNIGMRDNYRGREEDIHHVNSRHNGFQNDQGHRYDNNGRNKPIRYDRRNNVQNDRYERRTYNRESSTRTTVDSRQRRNSYRENRSSPSLNRSNSGNSYNGSTFRSSSPRGNTSTFSGNHATTRGNGNNSNGSSANHGGRR